jgi:anthranilate phosphoribosyltransferase
MWTRRAWIAPSPLPPNFCSEPKDVPMSISNVDALSRVIEHREIFHDEMLTLMRRIMSGEMSPVMIAALAVGLRVKKESIGEITAAAQVMREFATPVPLADRTGLVDMCGTGGDGAHTFNISTTATFVAAAAGAKVAKHGGRSVSSTSGSADVLEALGANINLPPAQVAQCLAECGIGFMFAPNHHPSMKHAAPVRRELGVRTIFNILGPLTNPAGAPNQVMGVFHPDLVGIQVRVLQRLGSEHVLIVHGMNGMDEISLSGETLVGELKNGQVSEYRVHPSDFGLPVYDTRVLRVANQQESVDCVRRALSNEDGPVRDIVLLNAGAAIYAGGVAASIEEGVKRAREAVASGAALAKLSQFVEVTNRLRPTAA